MGIENGVFNKQDLARLGVSRAELRRHVDDGALTRLCAGWYLRTREHDPAAAAEVRARSRWRRWRTTDSRTLTADAGQVRGRVSPVRSASGRTAGTGRAARPSS
ncbi:type IV toxin-antitoxin system AbiEi family antitoxin domain-containing protein [Gordonia iterans]